MAHESPRRNVHQTAALLSTECESARKTSVASDLCYIRGSLRGKQRKKAEPVARVAHVASNTLLTHRNDYNTMLRCRIIDAPGASPLDA